MHTPPGRFSQLRWVQTVACLSAMLVGGVMIGLALVDRASSPRVWLVAAGMVVLFLAVVMLGVFPLLLKMEATLTRHLAALRDIHDLAAQQVKYLDSIAEQSRISDAAKSLAHRSQELAAVHYAIRDEIRTEQWEPALHLISAVEQRFGFAREAARLREELEEARRDAIRAKLTQAIEMIDGFFRNQEWERAEHEIERLRHALPEERRVLELQHRMDGLKAQHKKQLTAAWEDALRRSDTDHAIDVLKELDPYLTPEEGQTLQASARSVFKEKLLQLGVQFRFAVKERRWQDALNTGLDLVRDFPNARMAIEVREKLDILRERARQETHSTSR